MSKPKDLQAIQSLGCTMIGALEQELQEKYNLKLCPELDDRLFEMIEAILSEHFNVYDYTYIP